MVARLGDGPLAGIGVRGDARERGEKRSQR